MALSERVVTATVESYYPQALQEATAARARAQNGYVIASATAAAIGAAGFFADLPSQALATKLCGAAAVVAWLISALLFLNAVTSSEELPGPDRAETAEKFVELVLARAKADRKHVERWMYRAVRSVIPAVALSALTLLLALILAPASGDGQEGLVVLSQAGSAAIAETCGIRAGSVRGIVGKADAEGLRLKLRVSACGSRGAANVVLPEDAIRLVVEQP